MTIIKVDPSRLDGLFWRKGLDRVLLVIGTVWFLFPSSVIVYVAFTENLGMVDWPATLVWYIAGIVALIVVGFFRKRMVG